MNAGWRAAGAATIGALLLLSGCGRSSGGTTATPTNQRQSSLADGDFGTLRSVCGKGDGHNIATGRGVTATSINLGVVSDAGFVGAPGLDQELWDASDVFTKWCNSLGGINGRKIIDTHLDSALTNYRQVVLEACQSDFALVGGGGVFDDTGQADRLKCLLPAWPGFEVTPQARASDLQWQALPAPLNQLNNGLEKWLTQKFPDSKGAVGYLASNVAATILTKRQDQEVFQQLGWNPTSGGVDAEFNALGETTWVPIATNLKQKGVKGLVWVGTPENLVALEQAMQAINYKPEWIFGGINGYDPALQKGFKTTPLPTYLPLEFAPFEYANQHTLGGTAIHQYLELFQKYLPKGKSHAALGINSFASWLLFAQAAKACGANLTPKCMYGQMQKTTKFNAGGLTGQSEIATQAPTQCFTATQAVLGGFKVVDVSPNTDVYNCSPSNIATLTGDYGKGTTLASVGKSVNDLK